MLFNALPGPCGDVQPGTAVYCMSPCILQRFRMKIAFENTLTTADVHRHIPHVFEVPAGTTRIHAQFAFSPRFSEGQQFYNQLCLSLRDPEGPRGVLYIHRDEGITLNAGRTTPGFAAGPVLPGRWSLDIDVYRILPPDTIHYSIVVTLSSEAITESAPVYAKPLRRLRGPGWYRGDLHAHTVHSDGIWDVPDLIAYARAQRHDFVTLTDHNTVSGLAQHDSLAEETLLTMGGLELTTFYGHAVVLGTRQCFEWRLDTDEHFTMPQLAQRVLDSGAYFITAHPMSPGDPECSGCHWEFEDMRPGNSPAVEVWNEGWNDYNDMGLALYYDWLNAGHRLVATSGSDLHGPPPAHWGRIGTNVIYADDLTEEAILAALRKGHSYLSAGPELLLTASHVSGVDAMCGDVLPNADATVTVRWGDAANDSRLRFIVDGRVVEERVVSGTGEASWPLTAATARWCNVELRDATGAMWALTNPIFFGRSSA